MGDKGLPARTSSLLRTSQCRRLPKIARARHGAVRRAPFPLDLAGLKIAEGKKRQSQDPAGPVVNGLRGAPELQIPLGGLQLGGYFLPWVTKYGQGGKSTRRGHSPGRACFGCFAGYISTAKVDSLPHQLCPPPQPPGCVCAHPSRQPDPRVRG